MLGWSFIVTTQTPEEYRKEFDETVVLTRWETGDPSGIRWINNMVKEGRAEQLYYGGYPNVYTVMSSNIRPFSYLPPNRPNHSNIISCPKDKIVTIVAWDMS